LWGGFWTEFFHIFFLIFFATEIKRAGYKKERAWIEIQTKIDYTAKFFLLQLTEKLQ